MYKQIKKYLHIVLLLMLILVNIVLVILWSPNDFYYGSDQIDYLTMSSKFYKALKSMNVENFLCLCRSFYAPLPLITTSPFYAIFGQSEKSAVLSNFIYFTILIFSTYGIGKELGSKCIGLVSAFMISTFPIIQLYLGLFFVDFSLMAMTTLSLYFLILTDYFRNSKYSILFGIALGLAALSKTAFMVFLGLPIIYVLINSEITRRKIIKNVIVSILIASAISLPWYLYAFNFIAEHFFKGYIKYELTTHLNTHLAYLLEYFTKHVPEQISPPFLILFLSSILLIAWSRPSKKLKKGIIILLLSIVPPFIFFTIIPPALPRYTLPALPAIAIVAAIQLSVVKPKLLKVLVIIAIIIVGMYNVYLFRTLFKTSPEFFGNFAPGGIELSMNKSEVERLIDYIAADSSGKPFTYVSFSFHRLPIIQYIFSFKDVKGNMILFYTSGKPLLSCILQANYSLVARDFSDLNLGVIIEPDEFLQQMNEIFEMFENNSYPINNSFKYLDTFNAINGIPVKLYKRVGSTGLEESCDLGIYSCLT